MENPKTPNKILISIQIVLAFLNTTAKNNQEMIIYCKNKLNFN